MRRVEVGYYEADDLTRELVMKVVNTGRISYGPMCREVEESMAEAHDSCYGVVSASGTDSLRAALHTLKIVHNWDDGDEVIVPATTFVATVNIVTQLNLKPIFVDVLPVHYTINPILIQPAITDKTRAIIPVNLLGQPADLSSIMSVAVDNDLKVVEDSCEAMFVKHVKRPVGSWGDIGCFSFYMAHLITAGVGGIAITDNHLYSETMRSLLNHGRNTAYTSIDDDDGLEGDQLAEIASKRFHFWYPGYSSRMTELQAALAIPQIRNREAMLAARASIASKLAGRLRKHEEHLILPGAMSWNEHSWMMFGITMRHQSKWPIMFHLEEFGIETRELLPLIDQPVFSDILDRDLFPVSKKAFDSAFYIGSHQAMTDEDIEHVGKAFDTFLGG